MMVRMLVWIKQLVYKVIKVVVIYASAQLAKLVMDSNLIPVVMAVLTTVNFFKEKIALRMKFTNPTDFLFITYKTKHFYLMNS